MLFSIKKVVRFYYRIRLALSMGKLGKIERDEIVKLLMKKSDEYGLYFSSTVLETQVAGNIIKEEVLRIKEFAQKSGYDIGDSTVDNWLAMALQDNTNEHPRVLTKNFPGGPFSTKPYYTDTQARGFHKGRTETRDP